MGIRPLTATLSFAVTVSLSASDALRPSRAHTVIITNTQDGTNRTSLRGAIIEANRRGGNNTIILTATNYDLSIGGSDEDAAQTGDLDIVGQNLTIVGQSNGTTSISANYIDRVFHVLPHAQLRLVNVILTGGFAPPYRFPSPGFKGESGGSILNEGTLIMKHCILTGNSSGDAGDFDGGADGGDGGAIYNTGTLMMSGCAVNGNQCGPGSKGGNGGGIFNAGFALLRNCVIGTNQAGPGYRLSNFTGAGGNGGDGGGVYNSGTMLVLSCTVGGNSSGAGERGSSIGIGGWITGPGGGGPGGSGGVELASITIGSSRSRSRASAEMFVGTAHGEDLAITVA